MCDDVDSLTGNEEAPETSTENKSIRESYQLSVEEEDVPCENDSMENKSDTMIMKKESTTIIMKREKDTMTVEKESDTMVLEEESDSIIIDTTFFEKENDADMGGKRGTENVNTTNVLKCIFDCDKNWQISKLPKTNN